LGSSPITESVWVTGNRAAGTREGQLREWVDERWIVWRCISVVIELRGSVVPGLLGSEKNGATPLAMHQT